MKLHQSLAVRIPAIILLVGLGVTVVAGRMRITSAIEALEEAELRFANDRGVDVSADIESSLRAGERAGARAAIDRANSLRNLVLAAYVDRNGEVLHSSDLTLQGRAASVLPIENSMALMSEVRSRMRGSVRLTDGGRSLVSAYPVFYDSSSGGIRGGSIGVVLHVYDLTSDRKEAVARAVRDGALQGLLLAAFSAGLWFYFRRALIMRIDAIARFAEAVERGEANPALKVGGSDELALLARRLEKMASELNERAEEVRRGRERYRALVESTEDWVWEVDGDRRFVYSSPTSTEVLGLAPAQVVGQPFSDLVAHDAERETDSSELLEALNGNEPFRLAVGTHRHASGRFVQLEHTASPAFDEDGTVIGFRGIARDITERRVLEEELARAQKLEALGRLAGGMAHDFNNILTAILGNVELARMAPAEDLAAHALQEVETAAERAAALTGQLLSFSRKRMVQQSVFRPSRVIGSMADMLSRIVGEQYELGLRLTSDRWVSMDESSFEQIVMNLVVNARDAMPEGGKIRVACDDGEGIDEGAIVIAVCDTGVGIAAEDLEHIFDPLYTTRDEGTGLGLATVKSAVDHAGGRIEVESAIDAGTTFWIAVPAVDSPTELFEELAAADLVDDDLDDAARILLCEDQESLSNLLATALRGAGFTVEVAIDGADGIATLETEPERFDLLVTDIVMPRSNGGELARAFLRHLPAAPVLFMSGYMSEIRGIDEAHFPNARFLTKPFRPRTLIQEVRGLLRRSATRPAPPRLVEGGDPGAPGRAEGPRRIEDDAPSRDATR